MSQRLRVGLWAGRCAWVVLAGAAWLGGCAGAGRGNESLPVTASDQTDAERRAHVRLELASAYFARGQATTALDEVKQALAIYPNYGDAYNLRGLILASMDDPVLAEESFRRALQINPGDANVMHNLGWFECQRRHFDLAFAQFDRALAQPQYRDQARTMLAKGVCQGQAQRWEDAERSLVRAYELDPSNPTTASNLAEVLYRRGQYERARFYIGRVNDHPEQSNAQTLWLALRIEHKLGNAGGVADLGKQLRIRFPQAPETTLLEGGRLDD